MTSEQEQLLEKTHDSLIEARVLDREEMQDFSASRPYFAVFYAAQALLPGKGWSFSRHSAVIAAFGRNLPSRASFRSILTTS
jgi:uncharacterized protein (UPF0332 family)